MNLNTDPVLTVNLTLCIVIFALGLYEFSQRRSPVELYVGIAFGLFGVSHLLGILGLSAALTTPLIIIRLAAYLLVIYGLYTAMAGKKKAK
jgi:hypothetical protein